MQASGSLVDVDIPKLPESPWSGIDIFCTSMELGRWIVKELDMELILGIAERRYTESPPDEESWGGGQRFKSQLDPKSPFLGVCRSGCFLSNRSQYRLNIARTLNKDQKKYRETSIQIVLIGMLNPACI